MNALIVDTSTEILAVATVQFEPQVRVLSRRVVASGLNHATSVVGQIEAVLRDVDPDRHLVPQVVGVALGPGSFTGLRIALATAKGLAAGWGVPLVGLDALAAMAETEKRRSNDDRSTYVAVVDARKQRFYVQIHRSDASVSTHDWSAAEVVSALEGVCSVVLTGYQGDLLAERIGALPSGWSVSKTTDWVDALAAQSWNEFRARRFLDDAAGPVYLRLSEAEEHRLARDTGV